MPSRDEYVCQSTSNANWFFAISVLLRVFQGIASASIQISAYSFATNEMNEEKDTYNLPKFQLTKFINIFQDTYIGYVEMALGVGDVIGPAIGGFCFGFLGFEGTFVTFGAMIMTGIVLSVIWIPASLNKNSVQRREAKQEACEEDQGRREHQLSDYANGGKNNQRNKNIFIIIENIFMNFPHNKLQIYIGLYYANVSQQHFEELTYSKILSIPHTKILLASACIVVILTLYVEPVIALYLHNVYSLSNASIGVFFLASAMTYIVGSPLASYFSQVFNRKAVIILAFGLMTLQSALLGPSALLGLPDSLVLVCLGDLLIGLCLSLALIPLLSELIDLLEKEKRFSPDSLSDMCSALFNSMLIQLYYAIKWKCGLQNQSKCYYLLICSTWATYYRL